MAESAAGKDQKREERPNQEPKRGTFERVPASLGSRGRRGHWEQATVWGLKNVLFLDGLIRISEYSPR